jgi:hypothetical protein
MSLLSLIVILVVIGLIMYAINTYIPMDANIKKILNIAVIIVVVIWLLTTMDLLPDLNAIRVGG